MNGNWIEIDNHNDVKKKDRNAMKYRKRCKHNYASK